MRTAFAAAFLCSQAALAQDLALSAAARHDVEAALAEVSADSLRAHIAGLVSFGTRHTLSSQTDPARGVGAAASWIEREFVRFGGALRPEIELHEVGASARIPNGATVLNVVARLPGTMPEAEGRVYYVVGHFDSRASGPMDTESDAPGANDDGSGTALVIELARALADHPLESTVVFLTTAGEEQGLTGAREHARKARESGIDIRAVLNNDIVGDPTGANGREARHEIRVHAEGLPLQVFTGLGDDEARRRAVESLRTIRNLSAENDSGSRQLARFVYDAGIAHNLPVKARVIFRPDRFLRGGDHTAFNEQGFAAVRFTETYENYDQQHQDVRVENGVQFGDLPEFVDYDYLSDVARLNLASLIHLANAPSSPANARVLTAGLAYSTTLRWSPSPEPDTAGYEVVWRETTAWNWENSLDVGNVSEATVNESKDLYLFGVRAYDKDGYRSPVTFATAGGR